MHMNASTRVTIERNASTGEFVVGDEDGEFARATTIAQAIHYASDLLYGPGTSSGTRAMLDRLTQRRVTEKDLYDRLRDGHKIVEEVDSGTTVVVLNGLLSSEEPDAWAKLYGDRKGEPLTPLEQVTVDEARRNR